ncbi:MAG: hypothetical protein HYY40_05260 [Bacteroidetes bacterium]|nr:hypothetical protein [Bacteroidota bacterium]
MTGFIKLLSLSSLLFPVAVIVETVPGYCQQTTKISAKELPMQIQYFLKEKYEKYSVTLVEKTTNINMPGFYKISLRRKTRLVYLYFDEAGTLVNKEKERIFTYDGTETEYKSSDEKPNTLPMEHLH